MAGTPAETPDRFVCMNCYTIAAGLPADGGPSPKEYESPVECGACGRDEFVEFDRFEREYHQRV